MMMEGDFTRTIIWIEWERWKKMIVVRKSLGMELSETIILYTNKRINLIIGCSVCRPLGFIWMWEMMAWYHYRLSISSAEKQ